MTTAVDMLAANVCKDDIRSSESAIIRGLPSAAPAYRFELDDVVAIGTTRHAKPPRGNSSVLTIVFFAVGFLGFILLLYGVSQEPMPQHSGSAPSTITAMKGKP